MSKLAHRTFEMYEHLEETVGALTPKSIRYATEAADPETWSFEELAVSLSGVVYHVQFNEADYNDAGKEAQLRKDLDSLAKLMKNDSKVAMDFSNVESISEGSIAAVAQLMQKMKNKGSRLAVFGIGESAREAFFAPIQRKRSLS